MTDRHDPIVPHVLLAAPRPALYDLPDLRRAATRYHTASTVRVQDGEQSATVRQHRVWCLPTEQDWREVQETYGAWRKALHAFANRLRDLGPYQARLQEAGGLKQAPNPLAPTVALADHPDDWHGFFDPDDLFLLPGDQRWRIFARAAVRTHTPKMVRLANDALVAQTGAFPCPDEAAWEGVQAAFTAALQARDQFQSHLSRLGTYAEALADSSAGRRSGR
jgi:hypothetical protein